MISGKFLYKIQQCWISWETIHVFLFLRSIFHCFFFFNFGGIHKKVGIKIDISVVFMKWKKKTLAVNAGPLGFRFTHRAQARRQVVSIYFTFYFMKTPKLQFRLWMDH